MSRFFLLRHAQSVANQKGFLAGRMPDIALSAAGKRQREKFNERAEGCRFELVISSPMQRCQETIETLIVQHRKPVIIDGGLTEVDYGIWTGKKFSTLNRDSKWRELVSSGNKMKFADGESIKSVQKRTIDTLLAYGDRKHRNILISTHADVIKLAIFHSLDIPISNLDKLVIDNASISIIDLSGGTFSVKAINDSQSLLKDYRK